MSKREKASLNCSAASQGSKRESRAWAQGDEAGSSVTTGVGAGRDESARASGATRTSAIWASLCFEGKGVQPSQRTGHGRGERVRGKTTTTTSRGGESSGRRRARVGGQLEEAGTSQRTSWSMAVVRRGARAGCKGGEAVRLLRQRRQNSETRRTPLLTLHSGHLQSSLPAHTTASCPHLPRTLASRGEGDGAAQLSVGVALGSPISAL